jgi:hypothetical protein
LPSITWRGSTIPPTWGEIKEDVHFQIAPPYWNPAEFVKRLESPGRLFKGVPRPNSEPLEQKNHGTESGEGGLDQVYPGEGGQPKPERGMNDGKQQGGQDDDPGEKQDGAIKIHDSSPHASGWFYPSNVRPVIRPTAAPDRAGHF